MNTINIVIVDDHQIIIDGLKALLADQDLFKVIGSCHNGQELINHFLDPEPDLILIDISMPILDGIETARQVKHSHPSIKVLVMTTHADKPKIKEMLKIGVDGYILKDSGKAEFIEAITTVTNGDRYFDKRVIDEILKMHGPKDKKTRTETALTKREKEIVRLIAEGHSTGEMSIKLYLSELTIDTHRKNIYTKLGINKVAHLVRYAIDEGLV